MEIGTSHFTSRTSADAYFDRQGISAETVDERLAAGEIHIGPPATKAGEVLRIETTEGRYYIHEAAFEHASRRAFPTSDEITSILTEARALGYGQRLKSAKALRLAIWMQPSLVSVDLPRTLTDRDWQELREIIAWAAHAEEPTK